jgi:acyl-CoA reductase-like NAD-dependent aldehyde dehydrogenase
MEPSSLNEFRMVIGGELVASATTLEVINPATERPIATVPDCTKAQLNGAVQAARTCFPRWRATPWAQRGDALRAMADKMLAHLEPLSELLMHEQGKPLLDARAEIARSAAWLRDTAALTLPKERRTSAAGRVYEIRHLPLGVIGAISPWNFPVSLSIWKIAPALLTGNTVVLKPSPYTPLTVLALGELFLDLLPPGVLNVVSGGNALGPLLTEHLDVDKIAFTGSTATGRAVLCSASATLKRVTLELGGNDPAIVLPGIDVEAVAPKIFWSAFRNAGQVCVASKRIYAHESIYDRLVAALAQLAEKNLPRPGNAEGATIGPVQNKRQYDRVRGMIEGVRAAGGRLIEPAAALPEMGYFIAPTLVDNPPDDWPIVREEPFGPVVPLLRYRDIEDAVRRANASEYGLGASIWGRDEAAAAAVAAQLETGTVWINSGAAIEPHIPFGGHKQSGLGVENGPEGLQEYTNVQVIAHSVKVA